MKLEVQRAHEQHVESPIWDGIEGTHGSYNTCLKVSLQLQLPMEPSNSHELLSDKCKGTLVTMCLGSSARLLLTHADARLPSCLAVFIAYLARCKDAFMC